jgi:hypothetical protein
MKIYKVVYGEHLGDGVEPKGQKLLVLSGEKFFFQPSVARACPSQMTVDLRCSLMWRAHG